MWPFSRVERQLGLVQHGQGIILAELRATQMELERLRTTIIRTGTQTMAKIEDVIDRINQQETMIDGLGVLVGNLRQQIADATANSGIPAAVQAKIDEAFAELDQNTGKLAAAIGTNTTGEPVPVGDQGGTTTDTTSPTVDAATGQPVDDTGNAA